MSLIVVTGFPCLLEGEGAGKDGRDSTVSRSAVGVGEAVPPEGGVLSVAVVQASDQRRTLVHLHIDLLDVPPRFLVGDGPPNVGAGQPEQRGERRPDGPPCGIILTVCRPVSRLGPATFRPPVQGVRLDGHGHVEGGRWQ